MSCGTENYVTQPNCSIPKAATSAVEPLDDEVGYVPGNNNRCGIGPYIPGEGREMPSYATQQQQPATRYQKSYASYGNNGGSGAHTPRGGSRG
jgi:hypothetical protein